MRLWIINQVRRYRPWLGYRLWPIKPVIREIINPIIARQYDIGDSFFARYRK